MAMTLYKPLSRRSYTCGVRIIVATREHQSSCPIASPCSTQILAKTPNSLQPTEGAAHQTIALKIH
jgi:hypothetical protein